MSTNEHLSAMFPRAVDGEAVDSANELAQVLQFSDFANRPRPPRRSAPEVDLPALDEAMRDLDAAANAALKLVFLTRHRLGLPQL